MSSVFLGKEGITSTSANYYANMAKELVQADMKRLEEVKFYDTELASIINPVGYTTGIGETDIRWLEPIIKEVSEMNELCAWLREAIKAKELMLNNLDCFEVWRSKKYPEENFSRPECPESPTLFTEDNIIESWSAEKRLAYLKLEAYAATFGKYIHPNGSIAKSRNEAHKVASHPTVTEGSGRECLIHTRKLTIPIEVVDNTFMQLQSSYRSFEQELNNLKAQLKEAVNEKNTELLKAYKEQMAQFDQECDIYHKRAKDVLNEYNLWYIEQRESISKLKIVIPNNLKLVYDKVVSASK